MYKKILKIFSFILTILAFVAITSTSLFSQKANDQFGFGNRVFLIQSALGQGTAYGLWDIPGHPGKDDGNLKGTKWRQLALYQREKGDPEDRVFRFHAAQGSAVGRYFINIGRKGHWGVNYIEGTGKIEARSRADHFEFKYIGMGKWKIYVKPGYIIGLEKNSKDNGTKLAIKRDFNGAGAMWTLYDTKTNKAFAPKRQEAPKSEYKVTLEDSLIGKNPNSQYFSQAGAGKFSTENKDKIFESYLDGMNTADQWSAIMNLLRAISQNKDILARRAMCKSIMESKIKKGSNFAERLLVGKIQEQINGYAAREKDKIAKSYISNIAKMIR